MPTPEQCGHTHVRNVSPSPALCDPQGHTHTSTIFVPVTPTFTLCFPSAHTVCHTAQLHAHNGQLCVSLTHTATPEGPGTPWRPHCRPLCPAVPPLPPPTGKHSWLPPGGGLPVAVLPEPPSTLAWGRWGGSVRRGRGAVAAAAPLQTPSCGICQGQIATPEPAGSAPRPLSPHYFCVPGLWRHLPPSPAASRLLPASPTPLQGGPAVWGLLFSSFSTLWPGRRVDAGQSCWTLNGRQDRCLPPGWDGFSAGAAQVAFSEGQK